MDLTVENLCGLLKRSGLVSYEEIHALYDRWKSEETDDVGSTSRFTRWLIEHKVVTEYQATLLNKGMVDDFFLGPYRILDRLGRGRMAGVYKARHADGRVVAIKVLPPSRTKVPALMARFLRESSLAVAFRHPNVVRSFEVGETKGLHYIVMELLDGETVEEVLLRRGRISAVEAANIVHQALLGLQHLSEHDVVHRDIKPSNLMLVPGSASVQPDTTLGSTVKILDIGLARKILEEQIAAEKIDPSEVTREGVLLGTPDYLSPEQARDPRTIDIRSDIYSLGCVFHHLVAGQTPFPDSNLLNLMLRHAGETPRPLRDFVPGFPDGLQKVIAKMMAKSPEQRYASPADAADALAPFLSPDAAEVPDAPADAETVDAEPVDRKAKKKLSSTIETARALKPKFARLASKLPIAKGHAPPAQLPENIELVPLTTLPSGPSATSPLTNEPAAPFPSAESFAHADEFAHADDVVSRPRLRRPPRRSNSVTVVLSLCVAMLLAGVGVALLMIFSRR